jgi:hypothetical protein
MAAERRAYQGDANRPQHAVDEDQRAAGTERWLDAGGVWALKLRAGASGVA